MVVWKCATDLGDCIHSPHTSLKPVIMVWGVINYNPYSHLVIVKQMLNSHVCPEVFPTLSAVIPKTGRWGIVPAG